MLGGRAFTLSQQRAAIVERILSLSSEDTARNILKENDEPESPTAVVTRMFANWDNVIQAALLMFGYEDENAERNTAREHLLQYLNPGHAIRLFERWWEVNEIDAFFERGGRVLMPIQTVEELRRIRQMAYRDEMEEDPEPSPPEIIETPAVVN